jgi:hypothetical protein
VYVNLAVEDILAEHTLRTILHQTGRDYNVGICLGGRGNGYLRERTPELNRSAAGFPMIILTDQDTTDNCPPVLIAEWLGGRLPQNNLLFRVAVMEIEAWLLADREPLSEFLAVPLNRMPQNPDQLPDPKQFMVNLARGSRLAAIRESLVPRTGSTARIGPDYNGTLLQFVAQHWSVARARINSPSLDRAYQRLLVFTPELPPLAR